ncbi:MAG: HK97-gp10 family putative phage morphogenesis protein [Planctomycetota bacterium]|jgi:HK97 gp10 family phage protein
MADKLAHIDISGLRIDKITPEISEAMQKGLIKGAEVVADKAKTLAPHGETGALARSIHGGEIGRSRKKGKVKLAAVWTYTGEGGGGLESERKGWYGGRVETGTSKMRARPFMRPAARKSTNEIGRLVQAEVKKVR